MRERDTRYKPGQSGNPTGRPKGARNKATVAAETLLEGEAETITRKCIDLALEGDLVALRLCLSRIVPAKRERNIQLDLPPLEGSQDVLKGIATVLEAVGDGALTPSEGASITRLLEAYRGAFETVELENRLQDLEARICGAN